MPSPNDDDIEPAFSLHLESLFPHAEPSEDFVDDLVDAHLPRQFADEGQAAADLLGIEFDGMPLPQELRRTPKGFENGPEEVFLPGMEDNVLLFCGFRGELPADGLPQLVDIPALQG
jgi:hypothetical protein